MWSWYHRTKQKKQAQRGLINLPKVVYLVAIKPGCDPDLFALKAPVFST